MIQELVTVLGLTATDLKLTTDQWDTHHGQANLCAQTIRGPEVASGDDENTELLTTTEENLAIAGKAPEAATTLRYLLRLLPPHLLLFLFHLMRPLLILIEKEEGDIVKS